MEAFRMEVGYYPGWIDGFVKNYFDRLIEDGQRKKAEAKLRLDILTLQEYWPATLNVTVRLLKGHELLWELKRDYQGIAYRVFFCTKGNEMWLLHAIEKKSPKTPWSDVTLAYKRMTDVLVGKVRKL
jgi:phage-related protein